MDTYHLYIGHYIAESRRWEKRKVTGGKHSTRCPVVYRYTHDSEPGAVPKQLVRVWMVEEALERGAILIVPSKTGVITGYVNILDADKELGSSRLRVHMRDVH